jgi:hypothetical protein
MHSLVFQQLLNFNWARQETGSNLHDNGAGEVISQNSVHVHTIFYRSYMYVGPLLGTTAEGWQSYQ